MIAPKQETAQISINMKVIKQTGVESNSGIILRKRKAWITNTQDMDESLKHYAEGQNLHKRTYTV